ncbi:MAG TPA: hypothetical protein VF708_12060 [Pyrinomonadaceae bacterium]
MSTFKQEESRQGAGAWVILSVRYGGDIRDPSLQQLQQALGELFEENIPGMTEADYMEHPNTWLRYGFDEGPEYVLDVYRDRSVIFAKYADQDDADPLWEYRMNDVSREKALALWQHLIEGKLDDLEAEGWEASI